MSELFPTERGTVPSADCSLFPPIYRGEQGTKGGLREPENNWVYVLGNADNRLVKISTSADIAHRLVSFQAGSPVQLYILLAVRAHPLLKGALHRRFHGYRRHGEWFDFGERDHVAEICAAIGYLLAHPEQTEKQVNAARQPLNPTEWYVAELLAAGAPEGMGRDRLQQWAREHDVALPGRRTALAAVTAALKQAHADRTATPERTSEA